MRPEAVVVVELSRAPVREAAPARVRGGIAEKDLDALDSVVDLDVAGDDSSELECENEDVRVLPMVCRRRRMCLFL